MRYEVIVIGAGAAGLMAAGTAAREGARTLLLEKMEKPGRKLRITGKGRCNLTTTRPWDDFVKHVRVNGDFLRPAFEAFDNRQTADFFRERGVELVVERGERVFPASGKAWEVCEALDEWCRRGGAELRCNTSVTKIIAADGRIKGVQAAGELIECDNVILCTGGVSFPATGSTGDGYGMAHALGHGIEPIHPALIALQSGERAVQTLRGVQLRNVSVSLLVDGREADKRFGEMEFIAGRRGGPVELAGATILQLSRDAVDALSEGRRVEIAVDLKPAIPMQELVERIAREKQALKPFDRFENLIRKLLPAEMAAVVARGMKIPMSAMLSGLGPRIADDLAAALKNFRLPVSDYAPMEDAIVTAGGVDVASVDPATMQSRLIQGLYFAGEVLDLDADTGGYNLQTAFSTGRLAGLSAAKNAKR